jgi:hypothetical protein
MATAAATASAAQPRVAGFAKGVGGQWHGGAAIDVVLVFHGIQVFVLIQAATSTVVRRVIFVERISPSISGRDNVNSTRLLICNRPTASATSRDNISTIIAVINRASSRARQCCTPVKIGLRRVGKKTGTVRELFIIIAMLVCKPNTATAGWWRARRSSRLLTSQCLRWGTEWSSLRGHRGLGSWNTFRRRHSSAILVVLLWSLGSGGTSQRGTRFRLFLFLILILRVPNIGRRRLILSESHG